ncbi:ATP-binding protein [Williamsia sterculiae]|uniref:biotin carboxylase n=1 Tax=Williamsia sterculiae TaxID=1344003 RepID=A0A1N7GPZ8_9NOCA|nr:biotin carboxylase N-terminal domain-containing protein [Williamsia sterculiae]SIS14548.1 propionyl-CoA carboxylase alpha chain [Williamsia sterculiae]
MTTTDITSVLVANRGEIARRVFHTCRELGIGTVAVFSDPDADAPHVREADVAVRLPGSTSAETYLQPTALIAAARSAGADAIHPGYGFLSENAGFAQQVIDAGLVWIGPTPKAIDAMGSKVNAKQIMGAAGVPLLGDLDPETVTEADLPVLIKASAGGGGRGMRIVRDLAELPDQLEGARREAQSAFGDATVFCEPYVERGHHIEVQVLADTAGTVWAVGERECSIQRRHQKVVEEAPAPLVERIGGELRTSLYSAARAAAEAIGYQGAGTVEFLADDAGRFWFLEMNTRLQVEHPVTEATTGLDLVQWQLRVAAGESLVGEPPHATGHAIEVRLYAEDPAADWQPQSGTVTRFEIESDSRFGPLSRAGIRVDSGVRDGSEISTFYDPMLAKVISWAPTRRQAAARLATALQRARLHGLTTNRDMLINTLRNPLFLAGDTDTGFIDTVGLGVLSAPLADADETRRATIAATLATAAAHRSTAGVQRDLPAGWRNLFSAPARRRFLLGDDEVEVAYRFTRTGVTLPDDPGVEVVAATPDQVVIDVDGLRRHYDVAIVGDRIDVDGVSGSVTLTEVPRFVDPNAVERPGSLLAPMPGAVIRVAVEQGDHVTAGQPLLWMEAMKMEHTIAAPADGVVTVLSAQPGQQLAVGDVLAVITGHDEEENA